MKTTKSDEHAKADVIVTMGEMRVSPVGELVEPPTSELPDKAALRSMILSIAPAIVSRIKCPELEVWVSRLAKNDEEVMENVEATYQAFPPKYQFGAGKDRRMTWGVLGASCLTQAWRSTIEGQLVKAFTAYGNMNKALIQPPSSYVSKFLHSGGDTPNRKYRSSSKGERQRSGELVNFANNLKEMRVAAGLSRAALAQKSGVSGAVIYHIEKCERWGSDHSQAALAGAIGIDIDTIFDPNVRAENTLEKEALRTPPSPKEKPAKKKKKDTPAEE